MKALSAEKECPVLNGSIKAKSNEALLYVFIIICIYIEQIYR
jgi:hypothetical protein